jgi:hypothetical protein
MQSTSLFVVTLGALTLATTPREFGMTLEPTGTPRPVSR